MKEIYLDFHETICESSRKKMDKSENEHVKALSSYCEINPHYFLLCLFNEFILIKYHLCHEKAHIDKIDLGKNLVSLSLEKISKIESFKIERSIHLDRLISDKEYMVYDTNFTVKNINYIYTDNAKKPFVIMTTATKNDKTAINKKDFENNYLEARKMLVEKNIPFLVDQIDFLYETNLDLNRAYYLL